MPGELCFEQILKRRGASATFKIESHAAPRRYQEFANAAPTLIDVVFCSEASQAKCNEATATCVVHCCVTRESARRDIGAPFDVVETASLNN